MTFDSPNFTQVPNKFIDDFMSELSPAQVMTMLVVLRYTTGYHCRRAPIALNTFIRKTGLSRQGVVDSLKDLAKKGWIKSYKGTNGKRSEYEILIKKDTTQISSDFDNEELSLDETDCSQVVNSVDYAKSEVVNSVDQGSQLSRLGVVNSVDQINKVKENNEKKDNVRTLPPPIRGKREDFSQKLEPEQKKIHDALMKYKPDWGEPMQSKNICAWFLSETHGYTAKQVEDAFLVYRQDCAEAKAKGRSIDNMGGYILKAIREKRIPKDANFDANKATADRMCKNVKGIEVKEKYVSYTIGLSSEQIPFSLPIQTFLNVLESAMMKLQFSD